MAPTAATPEEEGKDVITVNGDRIQVFHEWDPAANGWDAMGSEYGCDFMGVVRRGNHSRSHEWLSSAALPEEPHLV